MIMSDPPWPQWTGKVRANIAPQPAAVGRVGPVTAYFTNQAAGLSFEVEPDISFWHIDAAKELIYFILQISLFF